jgi:LysM repeat protein
VKRRTILAATIVAAFLLISFLPSNRTSVTTSHASSDPISTGNWTQDKYDWMIVQWSYNYGLNPWIVKAVMQLESGFDQWATSPGGDIGLMQIKLGTAQGLGYFGGWDGLYDPYTNIHYGTDYLHYCFASLGWNWALSIQAYNLSPESVQSGARNWWYYNTVMNDYHQLQSEHSGSEGGYSLSSATYTVQPGDSLWSIGQKFGVSWQSIAQANGISYPYIIYVEQVLTIPGSLGGVTNSQYTVQPGDSLWLIGQKLGVSWQSIAEANGISYPYIIYPGEVLTIP